MGVRPVPIADGVGSALLLTVALGLRCKAVPSTATGCPKVREAASARRKRLMGSTRWTASATTAGHRYAATAGWATISPRTNAVLTTTSTLSGRGSGASAWRESADQRPDGSADGRRRCLSGHMRRRLRTACPAVSGRRPTVERQRTPATLISAATHKRATLFGRKVCPTDPSPK